MRGHGLFFAVIFTRVRGMSYYFSGVIFYRIVSREIRREIHYGVDSYGDHSREAGCKIEFGERG